MNEPGADSARASGIVADLSYGVARDGKVGDEVPKVTEVLIAPF